METVAVRSPSTRLLVVFSLLLVNFFTIASMYFVVPGLDDFAIHFGVTRGEVGALAWINTLGYSLTNLFLGMLLSRLRMKPIIVGGLVGLAICNFLMALSTTFPFLLTARFLSGVAAGLVIPTSWAYVFTFFDAEEQRKAVGLLSLDLMLAYLIALPIGSYLVESQGTSTPFTMAGVATLMALLSVAIGMPMDSGKPNGEFSIARHFRTLGDFLVNPLTRRFLLIIGLWSFGYNSLFSYLGIWIQSAGLENSRSALFFVYGIAASLGCLYSPRLSRPTTIWFWAGAIACLVAAVVFSSTPFIYALAITAWFFFDRAVFTHLFSQTGKLDVPDVAQFTPVVLLALLVASTVGTAAVGGLLDVFQRVNWTLGAVYLIAVTLAALLPYRRLVRSGAL